MTTIKQQLEKSEFVIHGVVGTSMYPLFVEDEDLVQIIKPKNKLKVDDIVLFTRDDNEHKYILHRIIEVKNDYCIVCGDNQNKPEVVFDSQILGVVDGYYKKDRFVSLNDEEYKDYLNNLCRDIKNRETLKPLTKDQKNFLDIVRSILNSTKINQKDFNFNNIYEIANKQQLVSFVYSGIDKDVCPKDIYSKFEIGFFQCIQRNTTVEAEKQKIINKLNKLNTKYIQLKGNIIDDFYPVPGSRYYSDIDILINEWSKLDDVMNELGYTKIPNHEYVLKYTKEPYLRYEFHQKLFIVEDKIGLYFNDIFNKAIKVNENEFKMTNEDFVAYYIAHFYKHSLWGTGLRFYLDLYLILKNIEYDKTILENQLKQLDLYDFYLYVTKSVNELFIEDNTYPLDQNNIFTNSVYGTAKNIIAKEINEKGNIKYIFGKLFPSKSYIYQYMPIAHKYHILLPVAWIYRLFVKVTDKEESIKVKLEYKYLTKKSF